MERLSQIQDRLLEIDFKLSSKFISCREIIVLFCNCDSLNLISTNANSITKRLKILRKFSSIFANNLGFFFKFFTFPYLTETNNLLDALDSCSSDFAGQHSFNIISKGESQTKNRVKYKLNIIVAAHKSARNIPRSPKVCQQSWKMIHTQAENPQKSLTKLF